MEKLIRFCDHCHKSVPGIVHFEVPTGTQKDPASGKTEEVCEALDLCPDAQALVIARVIEFMGRSLGEPEGRYEWGKYFIARWKKDGKVV